MKTKENIYAMTPPDAWRLTLRRLFYTLSRSAQNIHWMREKKTGQIFAQHALKSAPKQTLLVFVDLLNPILGYSAEAEVHTIYWEVNYVLLFWCCSFSIVTCGADPNM